MGSNGFAEAAQAFMASYKSAFERFDAPAIGAHFAVPGHAVSEGGEIGILGIADPNLWGTLVGRILGMYRALGVAGADVVEESFVELSPRLGVAVVEWLLRDAAGAELYRFSATYTLVDPGDGFRIVALTNNELPRYLACHARLVAAGTIAPPA